MRTVRIGLITTIDRNIGDDFIREGIVQVLRTAYSGCDVRFLAVNKRLPFTVYPRWHPLRWVQVLDRLPQRKPVVALKARASQVMHPLGGSRFDRMDMIVHCGAPVMWRGCHRSVWASPLWNHVVARLSDRVPVMTLAAGSAYPWQDQPEAVTDPLDATFLRRVLDSSRLTTARDPLVSRLADGLGAAVPTLPCSAFLVGKRFAVPSVDPDGLVLFNYMPGGGHWTWGQGIDEDCWMVTARTLIERLSRRHQVAFLCHSPKDYEAALSLNAELPRFMPTSIESYFSLISRSKAAITNRIHGAVAMAGLGIPSISVGTDTRMLTLAPIGVPYTYVKDANHEELEDGLEALISRQPEERERLISLRDATWDRYVSEVMRVTNS